MYFQLVICYFVNFNRNSASGCKCFKVKQTDSIDRSIVVFPPYSTP